MLNDDKLVSYFSSDVSLITYCILDNYFFSDVSDVGNAKKRGYPFFE